MPLKADAIGSSHTLKGEIVLIPPGPTASLEECKDFALRRAMLSDNESLAAATALKLLELGVVGDLDRLDKPAKTLEFAQGVRQRVLELTAGADKLAKGPK